MSAADSAKRLVPLLELLEAANAGTEYGNEVKELCGKLKHGADEYQQAFDRSQAAHREYQTVYTYLESLSFSVAELLAKAPKRS